MEGGELFQRIQDRAENAFTEREAAEIMREICKAIRFLHSLNIAHRDVKPENLLYTRKDHTGILKLTDFGFAKESYDCHTDTIIMSETFCGTEPYYSPQIVARKPYNAFAADVWAMGVTLFCMLNNKFPFHFGDSKKMLIEQTDRDFIKTRYVKRFPSDLRNFQEKFFFLSSDSCEQNYFIIVTFFHI